jgi:serine protease Do
MKNHPFFPWQIVVMTSLCLGFVSPACAASAEKSGTLAMPSTAEKTAKGFTEVAKKAIPSVVAIKVRGKQKAPSGLEGNNPFQDEFFQRFFGMTPNYPQIPQEKKPEVLGQASGFFVSPDGYLMTNSHVVQNADEIIVMMRDGRELTAKMVGQDPNTDIAIIKVEGQDFPYLEFGNSDDLEIGEWAIAVGSPFGLQASLTVGVVSAKGRNNLDLANVEDFIQTDAAINRGNSGGPLLDIDSKVVGMNTAIVSNMATGGYLGVGFAIPSNMAKRIMEQLIHTGAVTRGFIGVTLQTVDYDLAQAFGLKQSGGAVVADVAKESPAEKAGLKQGDIILTYNKLPVNNIATLRNAITLMKPGAQILLTLLRENRSMDISVEVGSYPTSVPQAVLMSGNKLGFDVQELTPETARTLGVIAEKGLIINRVDANSVAALAGLKKGALILAVNQKPVANVEQFHAMLQEVPAGRPVLLLVKQGDVVRFVSLKAG